MSSASDKENANPALEEKGASAAGSADPNASKPKKDEEKKEDNQLQLERRLLEGSVRCPFDDSEL